MIIKVPKTLNNLCVGDIVIDLDDRFMKVLGVINHNCYILSPGCHNINSILLENADNIWTIKQLEFYNCKPYKKRSKDKCI